MRLLTNLQNKMKQGIHFKHMKISWYALARLIIFFILMILVITLACTSCASNLHSKDLSKQLTELQANFSDAQKELEKYSKASLSEGFSYQTKYPDLYVKDVQEKKEDTGQKVVYLTFDDGPSKYTTQTLDLLERYNVKATFFVVNYDSDQSAQLYKDIVQRGHSLGIHTATHDYKAIYASVDGYLEDFNMIYQHLKSVAGVEPVLFRFPGGSINSYNVTIYRQLIAEMQRRGFTYHDWNVDSGDTKKNATPQSIHDNVVSAVTQNDKSVVLLHDSDTKGNTVQALESIIVDLQAAGYEFRSLDGTVKPFHFTDPE